MICQVAIIMVTILFSSNYSTSQYLLITICVAIVVIHLIAWPYSSKILNIFDGLLLVLLLLVTILLFIKSIDATSVVQIAFVLLILSLVLSFALYLFVHKLDGVKKFSLYLVNYCYKMDRNTSSNNSTNPMHCTTTDDVDPIIDDGTQMNATMYDA